MDEYLFANEIIIEIKRANFLLDLDEHGLPRFGHSGLDTQMRSVGLPDKHEAIGGKLYLTNFRLFFRSHRFNRFTGNFSIFLSNIAEAKDVSQTLTVSRVMQIITRNHDFEFVVWKIPKLIAAINAARDCVSPEQVEELKKAVRGSPEKCGDGMNISPPVMNTL